jgi:RNA polymerase sigma-70 factor, ECF subfamily
VNAGEFEAVYARTSRALRAYLFRLGRDLALADDVLQETYLRYLAMDPARRAEAPERPLLFRIATNLMYDCFRRSRRGERAIRAWPQPAALAPPRDPDLADAFGTLAERERALLWLAYVEGWRHDEMAGVLGVKASSVRVLLFRAKSALARVLRERGLAPRKEDP